MRNRNYFADWETQGWPGVVEDFGTPCPEREPKFVFARYNREDYSGSATVITSNGRKFQVVEGGHCSCYGLEGQWEPTEHGLRELRKMMKAEYGFFHEHRDDLERWIKRVFRNRRKPDEIVERQARELILE